MGFDFAQPTLVERSQKPCWLSEVVGVASLLRENLNPQISGMLFPHHSLTACINGMIYKNRGRTPLDSSPILKKLIQNLLRT